MADNIVNLVQPPTAKQSIVQDFSLLLELAEAGKIRSFLCLWIGQDGAVYGPHYMASATDQLALSVIADLEIIEKYNSDDE